MLRNETLASVVFAMAVAVILPACLVIAQSLAA